MKSKISAILCICLMASVITGCATTEERENVKRGAAVGAVGGALTGLALGAITGDAELAAAGATAGEMYEYDQNRQDRRAEMVAESVGGAKKGETADDAGKRHMEDFMGDWKLDVWALGTDGKKISANGHAKVLMENKETARLEYKDIKADGYDQTLSGFSLLGYSPEEGFSLENEFSGSPDIRKYVGEYIPDKNIYNFYPLNTREGETESGIIRSNVRIELRVSGNNLFVAETYTMIEGDEVIVQSYRFTRQ